MAEEIRAQSYVGFDSITQQIEHKLLKRGFQFNVILVGEYPCSSLQEGSLVAWLGGECGTGSGYGDDTSKCLPVAATRFRGSFSR